MESKVRALKLETALDAERARLAALRKRHYQLAQLEEVPMPSIKYNINPAQFSVQTR